MAILPLEQPRATDFIRCKAGADARGEDFGLTTGETCQFGYLNLGQFHNGHGSVPVDLDTLATTVTVLVRSLDDAVEASLPLYPHSLSARVMTAKRKIGVGVCGLILARAGRGVPVGHRLLGSLLQVRRTCCKACFRVPRVAVRISVVLHLPWRFLYRTPLILEAGGTPTLR